MTNRIDFFQVDSFTETPFLGNPAGVILDAEDLNPEVRQRIARELNCSETAFVSQTGPREFRFRYYTPAIEVNLCGHATIAALHVLHERTGLTGDITVDTNVGLLPMTVDEMGRAWMQQAPPQFRSLDETVQAEVIRALRMARCMLDDQLPFEMSFTGLWDIMVPFKNRNDIFALSPHFDELAELSRQLGAASVHVYTLDTVEPNSSLHARDFSPAVGVNEDPHTGTANGALAALLVAHRVLKPGQHVFEQGWSVFRPGYILVDVAADMTVSVGGRAVTVMEGSMRVSQ